MCVDASGDAVAGSCITEATNHDMEAQTGTSWISPCLRVELKNNEDLSVVKMLVPQWLHMSYYYGNYSTLHSTLEIVVIIIAIVGWSYDQRLRDTGTHQDHFAHASA